MNNILELIVGIYLIFCLWNGYRKGLIKIVLSMIALLATVIISMTLSPHVSRMLREDSTIYLHVEEKTQEFVEAAIGDKIKEGMPARTDEVWMIDNLPLPKSIRTTLMKNNNEEMYGLLGIHTFEHYISSYLAGMIINAISFVAVFLTAQILIQLIIHAADLFAKLPGINGINHLAGLLAGALQGMLILWVFCLIVTACGSLDAGQRILGMIQESILLSAIYNHNYLVHWVTDLFSILV